VLAATTDSPNGVTWHLALRPVVHDADSADHLDSVFTVLTDGLRRGQWKRALGGK
jgi:hypothetical protein